MKTALLEAAPLFVIAVGILIHARHKFNDKRMRHARREKKACKHCGAMVPEGLYMAHHINRMHGGGK